jgi:hypothetical protein
MAKPKPESLSDDEINLLVHSLLVMQIEFDKERQRPKYFAREIARDRILLPGLIKKLNHAKHVTVMGGFQCGPFTFRFAMPEGERELEKATP